jgi:hypothetical protein
MIKGIAVTLLMAAAASTQPRIDNAKLESRAFTGSDMFKAQNQPAWFGYSVPVVAGEHNSCCHHSINGVSSSGCALEPGTQRNAAAAGPVRLEPSTELIVLFRVENGRVGKIRSFSGHCDLDAGGLPVIWLTGVTPAQSIALLDSFSPAHKAVVAAISLHADAAADAYLEKYTAPDQPESLRRDVTFGLSNRGPRGVDLLLKLAKSDTSGIVRAQALFWLAQKAGKEVAPVIRSAVENDPEFRVKERAVFALSQLPKDDGVPLLIDVAKHNRMPELRKKAMFWLGQSKDPRAIKFFEELLAR